jgi:hypothetical protein
MHLEKIAAFWSRNLCDFPEKALKQKLADDSIVKGLSELRDLLVAIYCDYVYFAAQNDEAQSHDNLMYTVRFLYAAGKAGEIKSIGNKVRLQIDKSQLDFKHDYVKQKPPVFQYAALPKYGFALQYYIDGKETGSFTDCDRFDVHYRHSGDLLQALHYLARRMPALDYKKDYAKTETLFLIADYESIFLGKNTRRIAIDPLDYRIMKTVGVHGGLWKPLIEELNKYLDIRCNLYERLHTWEVNFKNDNKVALNAYPKADRIEICFNLKKEQLKKCLELKDNLTPSVFENLKNAHISGKKKEMDIETSDELRSVLAVLENYMTGSEAFGH